MSTSTGRCRDLISMPGCGHACARCVRGRERLARLPLRHARAACGGRPGRGARKGGAPHQAQGGPFGRVRQEEGEVQLVQGEISDAPENLVNRHFRAAAPNELWLADITEFGLSGGKVYLSPILDCFDGGLPAWSIGTSPNAELANSSLEAACGTRREGQRPVTHSDRGCHYRWLGWIATCDENHLIRTMSKKGRSPDNSAMEGFFDRLKNEFFHHRDWSGVTISEFRRMLDAYLRYYNEERPKEKLGWLSPIQHCRSLGLAA